jgi:integrase/recombinase XerD
LALALVHDLRDHRVPVSEEDLADFETDVLAGFVLARASAGLADSTIRNDTGHLQLIRTGSGSRCASRIAIMAAFQARSRTFHC